MVYLLGGPPKVGKSVISETITRKHGINVVSTDSLGAVLEEVLNPEIEPGLFAVNRFNERAEGDKIDSVLKNTTELIDYIIEESKAVWKGVRPFILRERDEGRDVMIEGVRFFQNWSSSLRVFTTGSCLWGIRDTSRRRTSR